MTSTPTRRPRKWIAARIEELDPEVDYAEIIRLMTTYQSGTFVSELLYGYMFPHFMVYAHGAEPVWRDGGKSKIVDQGGQRSEDTNDALLVWQYHGPHHPETKKSVDTINKIHEYYAKSYPGRFSHHDDYLYVYCFAAALMHRLQLQMGLSGYTENQKIASHKFWQELGELVLVPGEGKPVEGFPADFDGVLAWLEEFESREFPDNPLGAVTSKAALDQFLFRRVPRRLHGLMRATVYSFYADSIISAYQLRRPHPVVATALRRACGVAFWAASRLAPDPTESMYEVQQRMTRQDRREHRAGMKQEDDAFSQEFRSWMSASGGTSSGTSGMSCPHPAGQAAMAAADASASQAGADADAAERSS